MVSGKKKIVVGLTGGISSGKSTVLNYFKKLGAKTLDSDKIARDVVQKGNPALKEIVKKFGKEFLKKDGTLDRRKFGKLIFENKAKRKELEKIVHPRIIEVYKKNIKSLKSRVLVIDIPLLFEVRLQNLVDQIITVWVPRNVQIRRMIKKWGLKKEEAICRIQSQWPLEQKKKLSDFIIDNSNSLQETKKQVDALFKKIYS